MIVPQQTPQPINKKTQDFRTKYKTEICRYWIQKGFCPFLHTCTFAHSPLEIRNKPNIPPNYRTKPCINFTLKGYCPYGARCQYLHSPADDPEKDQEGQKTRSNSEESSSSRSSVQSKGSLFWSKLTHNKRIELIQNLGLDYTIRTSSRLMQLLNSNESEQGWNEEWMFQEIAEPLPAKGKKYSM